MQLFRFPANWQTNQQTIDFIEIFYEEIFDYIWEDLNKVNQKGAVVTEGAAYFPHIMKKLHVPEEQYAAITPT